MTNSGSKKRKSAAGELVRDLLLAALIALVVSFFIRPTIVFETSMQPTIDPGNYIIMSKQAYRMSKVKRGDVVIFKSDIENEETGGKKLLIKRVIGVPGDILTISDGEIYINGSRMEEKYIAEGGTPGELHNLKVGKDEVFVMGDHRKVSRDSREFGCISKDRIIGKAVFRIWPADRMRRL